MKTILFFITVFLVTSFALADDSCVLIALNAAQRQVYSQYGQVNNFRAGCLVVQQDNSIVYEWNGVSYSAIASSGSVLPSQTGQSGKFLSTNGSVTSWTAVAGGANTALSNLTATSLNQDLIGATNNAINLGSTAKAFNNGYISALKDSSDVSVIDSGHILYDAGSGIAADFSGNLPGFAFRKNIIPYSNQSYDLGTASYTWYNLHAKYFVDATNNVVMDNTRVLYDSASGPMFDWSTTGTLDAKTNKITNVADPASAQDAATKNYVDTHGGGSAAGSSTYIQYNTANAFDAASDFTWNETLKDLTLDKITVGPNSNLFWGPAHFMMGDVVGTGSDAFIIATTDQATATSGYLILTTGQVASGSNFVGNLELIGGDNNGTGASGEIQILSGNQNGVSGNAGDIQIGGGSSNAGTGGSILITAGPGVDADHKGVIELQAKSTSVTGPLVLASSTQTLTAGGTIDSSNSFNSIQAASPLSTSTSTVITGGLLNGQLLTVVNVGGNTITLKSGGNTHLPGATDYILAPLGSISLVWIATAWYTTASSIN